MVRPVKWTVEKRKEAVDKILQAIATCELGLDHICSADKNLPSAVTFYAWLDEDEELVKRYSRARDIQQQYCIDNTTVLATQLVARNPAYQIDPQAFMAYWKAMTWRAAKLAPKTFGDKSQVEVANKDGEKFKQDVTIRWADE